MLDSGLLQDLAIRIQRDESCIIPFSSMRLGTPMYSYYMRLFPTLARILDDPESKELFLSKKPEYIIGHSYQAQPLKSRRSYGPSYFFPKFYYLTDEEYKLLEHYINKLRFRLFRKPKRRPVKISRTFHFTVPHY